MLPSLVPRCLAPPTTPEFGTLPSAMLLGLPPLSSNSRAVPAAPRADPSRRSKFQCTTLASSRMPSCTRNRRPRRPCRKSPPRLPHRPYSALVPLMSPLLNHCPTRLHSTHNYFPACRHRLLRRGVLLSRRARALMRQRLRAGPTARPARHRPPLHRRRRLLRVA